MAGERCTATSQRGRPCRHAADDGSAFCFWHDPAKADERREVLSARGRAGQVKRTGRARERRAELAAVVALDTTTAIRGAIERALAAVEGCDAPAPVKANAVARLAGVALDIIRGADLEQEVERLKELICERWPEARAKLGRLHA